MVIDKISNFHEITPNFYIFIKIIFLRYHWKRIDQLLLPINVMSGHERNLLFQFCPLWAVKCWAYSAQNHPAISHYFFSGCKYGMTLFVVNVKTTNHLKDKIASSEKKMHVSFSFHSVVNLHCRLFMRWRISCILWSFQNIRVRFVENTAPTLPIVVTLLSLNWWHISVEFGSGRGYWYHKDTIRRCGLKCWSYQLRIILL